MWSEKQPIRTLTSAIRRCLFPKSPKTFRAYFGCHNHRRSQNFSKWGSHCVKVRVRTRLSCRPPRRVFDLKKVLEKGLSNYGQDIVMAFSPPVVGCLVKKGFQKGGSRAPHDPPGYALGHNSIYLFETPNFDTIKLRNFLSFSYIKRMSFSKQTDRSLTNGFSGTQCSPDYRETDSSAQPVELSRQLGAGHHEGRLQSRK